MLIKIDKIEETRSVSQRLAGLVQAGDVIALHGGLGAGKTTFARFFIQALLQEEIEVPSPTYTLVQLYHGPDYPIYHFDLYRLERPEDVFELGWDETVSGLSLIEWPDRAGANLPTWRLDLHFEVAENMRKVRLEPKGEDWQTRLHGF